MKRLVSSLWLVLLLIGSAIAPAQAVPVQAAPVAASAATGCPPPPTPVALPTQWGFNELYSVATLAANDAWTVGAYINPDSNLPFPLIEHWDGASWSSVTPAPYYQASKLVSVAAVSPNDVWAVGAGGTGPGGAPTPSQPLLEHWNGSAWSQVPSPQPTAFYSYAGLTGVTALAADNVWAVGFVQEPSALTQAFVIHWDGHTWTQVATPADSGGLSALAAVAANDIWAVGSVNANGPGGLQILHWNGSAWLAVTPPKTGGGTLTAVSARAANDVWAVGSVLGSQTTEPLTLHWDGAAWTQVAAPAPTGTSILLGVVARAANDVWAVGRVSPAGYTDRPSYQPLWEHWNGTVWAIVAVPVAEGSLYGVAAGPGTVWAVGTQGRDAAETLITQWNGSNWAPLASPNVGRARSTVDGLGVLTTDDAWAVGNFNSYPRNRSGAFSNTLTRHWDGHTWTVVASPNAPDESYLNSVATLTHDDAWAVGEWGDGGDFGALIEHWDGTQWHIVVQDTPNTTPVYLFSVAAVNATDVWAVGSDFNPGQSRSRIVHWDGNAWTRIPSPMVGTGDNDLRAVTATAADDVWAAGFTSTAAGYTHTQPLLLHWNGMAWSSVVAPALPDGARLFGIWAGARDNAWAVGQINNGTTSQILIMHWDGSSWSLVAGPNVGLANSSLTAVAGHAANDVWAAGYSRNGQGTDGPGLLLHWDGRDWSQSATNPAQPAFFTSIAVPAAGEAWVGGVDVQNSRVPQALILRARRFSDVAADDTFYGPINDLVNRGVLTGYSDCTFRPAAATSRGQMSKIVVAAAGWPLLHPNRGHFADVSPTNVFYAYIETAVAHGLISGYHDGLFRPSEPVTRAQVSKMVVLAAGWPITTAGGPHFSDVPIGNGFYGYVETARAHGILTGYSDGTFRLNAPASRGQISQIVSTALPGPAAKH